MPSFTALMRPLAPRVGVQLASASAAIGTGGIALVATATVSVHVPLPVNRKCKLLSLNVVAKTAAAGGSTITAQAFKRDNSGTPADRTLTATFDLTATKLSTTDKTYPFPITNVTDSQLIFQATDTLRIDVAAATTVTTAPQVAVVAEFAILS